MLHLLHESRAPAAGRGCIINQQIYIAMACAAVAERGDWQITLAKMKRNINAETASQANEAKRLCISQWPIRARRQREENMPAAYGNVYRSNKCSPSISKHGLESMASKPVSRSKHRAASNGGEALNGRARNGIKCNVCRPPAKGMKALAENRRESKLSTTAKKRQSAVLYVLARRAEIAESVAAA